jgi:hypothetical protein
MSSPPLGPLETRLRESELSRLRAWEQLARIRSVLEALCDRRVRQPERRDFEAEGDALVAALYEEASAWLEDLARLQAFFAQLRPVIGQALPEEEAESLRLSMLEHLPQRPLRLGEVRLRLERAWRTGALPPEVQPRGLPPPAHASAGRRAGAREGPPGPQEFAFVGLPGPPSPPRRRKARPKPVKAAPKHAGGGAVAEPAPARQATFAWG